MLENHPLIWHDASFSIQADSGIGQNSPDKPYRIPIRALHHAPRAKNAFAQTVNRTKMFHAKHFRTIFGTEYSRPLTSGGLR
jgi:hypothetical protein